MAGEYGTKETEELVAFIIEMGNGVGKSREDGAWNVGDFAYFMPALMAAPAAFQGINLVPKEIGDMDKEEAKKIYDFVLERFDIPQDDVEAVVEKALAVGWEIYEFIEMLGDL